MRVSRGLLLYDGQILLRRLDLVCGFRLKVRLGNRLVLWVLRVLLLILHVRRLVLRLPRRLVCLRRSRLVLVGFNSVRRYQLRSFLRSVGQWMDLYRLCRWRPWFPFKFQLGFRDI